MHCHGRTAILSSPNAPFVSASPGEVHCFDCSSLLWALVCSGGPMFRRRSRNDVERHLRTAFKQRQNTAVKLSHSCACCTGVSGEERVCERFLQIRIGAQFLGNATD